MSRGPNWNKREEKILLECIENNPDNLMNGFDQASQRLKRRTASACNKYWYTQLRPEYEEELFITKSNVKKVRNTKNTRRQTTPGEMRDILELSYNALSHQGKKDFLKEKFDEFIN